MEKIDLSTNSKDIEQAYSKVVRNDGINYVVLTVDKSSVASVTATGHGDLHEFVEHFEDGHVQFGLARVTVPGSDVFKNLLLGWCPDNAAAKARLSFASNFADIANVLVGYHVQITARDQDDLDVEDFLSRVSAAAGARYSIQSLSSSAKPIARAIPQAAKTVTPKPEVKPIVPKPTPAKPAPVKPASFGSKPSFVPKSTGNPIGSGSGPVPIIKPKPASPVKASKPVDDEDDWAGEKEIEERDFSKKPLEDVPSAYTPTKVDIESLRKQKSDTISSTPKASSVSAEKDEEPQLESLKDRMDAYKKNESPSDGRLTSMPKPKVNNSVSSRFSPQSSGASFGSKPSFGAPVVNKKDQLVTETRDFASENGKTPAQIWAEKRGKYKSVEKDEEPVTSETLADEFSSKVTTKAEPESEEETPEAEPEVAPVEPESEEAEPEIEEESKPVEPPIIKPATSFAPPPARTVRAVPPPPAREPSPEPEPVVEPEPEAEPETKSSKPSAIADYTYEKDEDNEIAFEEGDLIIEIDFVDDDWWSGKHSKTGETGLFPSSYVIIQTETTEVEAEEPKASPAPPSLPSRSEPEPKVEAKVETKPKAIAEYAYEKDEPNEIGFEEGDLIIDIEFVDEDWWSGKHETSGEVGVFPANYVKLAN